nr:hypothetical protein [Aidingimonas lacisalsi]
MLDLVMLGASECIGECGIGETGLPVVQTTAGLLVDAVGHAAFTLSIIGFIPLGQLGPQALDGLFGRGMGACTGWLGRS